MRRWETVLFYALLALSLLIIFATAGWAQTAVAWDQPDHTVVTRWELGYFAQGAPEPFWTTSVPKNVATQTGNSFQIPIPKPVLGTNFVAKMKAYGVAQGGGEVGSEWSVESNPFSLLPFRPAAVTVK